MTPDEQFWGPPRRRVPLSNSMLVNFMGLALALLVAATVIGVVTLWPKGPKLHVRGFGAVQTHAAVVKEVRTIPCGEAGAHDCRRVTADLGHERTTSFTILGQIGSVAL